MMSDGSHKNHRHEYISKVIRSLGARAWKTHLLSFRSVLIVFVMETSHHLMTFGVSSSVTLLFDFWNVHGPAGMLLSVIVVLLLSVLYELLKVWRVWLGRDPASHGGPSSAQSCSDVTLAVNNSPSESSLTPIVSPPSALNTRTSLLQHAIQALLHILQVSLGYMLMLCVMSYNTWIFLGIIVGSVIGHFISFPLLGQT